MHNGESSSTPYEYSEEKVREFPSDLIRATDQKQSPLVIEHIESLNQATGHLNDKIKPETILALERYLQAANPQHAQRVLQCIQNFRLEFRSEGPDSFDYMPPERYLDLFLALENDAELGMNLITLMEENNRQWHERNKTDIEFSPTETDMIMWNIIAAWYYSSEISEKFVEFDQDLSGQIQKAFEIRIGQILAAAGAIITDGQADTTLYDGSSIRIGQLSEVTNSIILLNHALDNLLIRLNGHAEVSTIESDDEYESFLLSRGWLPSGNPEVVVQLRHRDAGDSGHNPNREYNGEARLNFLVGPPPWDNIPTSLDTNSEWRQRAISIRLDQENATSEYESRISLDIGSIFGDPENPNVKIGRLLAIGNGLISEEKGVQPEYNHVREVFSPQWGEADEFAKLTHFWSEKLHQLEES